MAKIICRRHDEKVFIEFQGDVALQHCVKLKSFLLTILDSPSRECIIDCSSLSSVDFSFIEMLLSFNLTMKNIDKIVLLKELPVDNPVERYFSAIGVASEFMFIERGLYGI
jgi:anti-anti-sigma regulatory factor